MKIFYSSQERFNRQIIHRWNKKGFVHHAGHRNILKYAFRTSLYWGCLRGEKVSEENRVSIYPSIF
jgi:hypothetical protein